MNDQARPCPSPGYCWMPMCVSWIYSSRSTVGTSNRYFCARFAKKRNVLDKILYRKKVGKIIFEIGPARLFSLTNALHYSEQKKTGSIKVLFLLNSYLILVVLWIGLCSNISVPSDLNSSRLFYYSSFTIFSYYQ